MEIHKRFLEKLAYIIIDIKGFIWRESWLNI